MAQIARQETYKDLDFTFKQNPNTNDVGIKKDNASISQSVLNILRTNHGERPFNYKFGANLIAYAKEDPFQDWPNPDVFACLDAALAHEPLNLELATLIWKTLQNRTNLWGQSRQMRVQSTATRGKLALCEEKKNN